MRSGASSSSVIQAMSDPLANVQDKPHSTWVPSSATNDVTRPVVTIAVAISTCDSTSDHLRLNVSASTPAGTSQHSAKTPCTAPISTICEAVKPASTTR
jgi:hypothetical protein